MSSAIGPRAFDEVQRCRIVSFDGFLRGSDRAAERERFGRQRGQLRGHATKQKELHQQSERDEHRPRPLITPDLQLSRRF
jgi:hypothetical protein